MEKPRKREYAVAIACNFRDYRAYSVRKTLTAYYFDTEKEAEGFIEFIKADHRKIVEMESNNAPAVSTMIKRQEPIDCEISITQYYRNKSTLYKWAVAKEYKETLNYDYE